MVAVDSLPTRDVQTWLGIAQCRESNDLLLPEEKPESGMLNFAVPAYSAMNVDDVIELFIYRVVGSNQTVLFSEQIIITEASAGRPLVWEVPYDNLALARTHPLHIVYEVSRPGGSPVEGPVQIMKKGEPPPFELPPVSIAHLADDAEEWDAAAFEQGARLCCRFAGGDSAALQVGDELMIHLTPEEWAGATLHLRLDETSIILGEAWLHLPFDTLLALSGETVEITWQWARGGACMGSVSRRLAIVGGVEPPEPLILPPPVIAGAVEEEDSDGRPEGFLVTDHQGSHVQVSLPEEVSLRDDDVLTLLWQGHPILGEGEFEPESDGRSFRVPSQLLAANMAKRFPVLYTLERYESIAYDLRVVELPKERYPVIQPQPAVLRYLSLAAVPDEGATFVLREWVFYAVGQHVRIVATGGDRTEVLRDAVPLTAAEFASKTVTVLLPRKWLEDLGMNTRFKMAVSASFDGGESFQSFLSLDLELRQ